MAVLLVPCGEEVDSTPSIEDSILSIDDSTPSIEAMTTKVKWLLPKCKQQSATLDLKVIESGTQIAARKTRRGDVC